VEECWWLPEVSCSLSAAPLILWRAPAIGVLLKAEAAGCAERGLGGGDRRQELVFTIT
jgi:hypothetical protein